MTYLGWYFLQHFLLLLGPVRSRALFFLVKTILYSNISDKRALSSEQNVLQKLFKILAALSLSMSRVVGQKASEPSLFERRLTGGPSLSTQP